MAKKKNNNSEEMEIDYKLDTVPENEKTVKKEKSGNLALKITALSLATVMVVLIVVGLIVGLSGKEVRLDYMKDNLSKYVTISEDDYKGYKVTVNIPAPGEQDLKDALIGIRYDHREEPEGDPVYLKNATVSVGDAVNIYYRGYTLNKDGSKNYFDGGCNFNSSTPTALEIGSGSFVSGFEYNLVGKNQKNYATMTKVTEGAVESTDIFLMTYSVMYGDGSALSSQSAIVDLNDPNLDAKWGKGFSEYWKNNTVKIGDSVSITMQGSIKSGASANDVYSNVGISEIYRVDTSKDILLVTAYFPHDYQEESLQNATAYFETYIVNLQDYTAPEINEEFITGTLKLTADDLSAYEGATLVEKYENMIRADLEKQHQESINNAIAAEFWKHIVEVAEFKKLPEGDVTATYNNLYSELQSAYSQYQSYYNDFDTFAKSYMGLSSSDNWQDVLRSEAETSVKQKIAFYYIIREENYIPSDEEYQALYNKLFDEQVQYYLDYFKITEADEDYAEKLESAKEEIKAMYDDEYWETQIIFAYGIEKICDLADLTNNAA